MISILIWFANLGYGGDTNYIAIEKKCVDCHQTLIEQAVVHAPTDDCINCHQSNGQEHPKTDSIGFILIAQGADLCYTCHDQKNLMTNVHPPVQDGECLTCHLPHSSASKSLLTEKSISDLCLNCHDLNTSGLEFMHKPVTDGQCTDCHNAHESDIAKMLKSKQPALCFTCHESTKEQSTLKNQHSPFKRKCSSCHAHHASSEEKLLTANTKELCFTCHSDLLDSISNAKHVHKILNQNKVCINCHSPHATNEDKLTHTNQKDLCLNCHNKTYNSTGKKVTNIKQLLQNSEHIHSPIDDGCSACHNPHYSSNSSLLIANYAQEQYTVAIADSFALCFVCHDTGLLQEESTSTITNFRNGNKNLHYLHMNYSKVRNCNMCHNVHGSKNKFLIQEKIVFGKWLMPINFTVLEKGGTCSTGCHEIKKYER